MQNASLILAIDDEPANLQVLEAMLMSQGYRVETALNGELGLEKADELSPDLILLDVMMPGLNGFEVAQRLKENDNTKRIPIVMITALNQVEDRVKALDAGADDFMTKPVNKVEVRARVRSLLKVKAYNDYMVNYQKELEKEVNARTEELQAAYTLLKDASFETIVRLSKAAEYKDDDTGAHVLRMSEYAAAVARTMGMTDGYADMLMRAAPMHDIGKIGIPDRVLLKPGKLDEEEWKIMRHHCYMGKMILSGSKSKIIQFAEDIAYTHHEKWDGSGYPRGLAGEDIPIHGRVVAIADVFDALTSKRPYKEPFSIEKSFSIIRESSGTHFDPNVVKAFFTAEKEILDIKERFRDDESGMHLNLENSERV